MDSIIRVSALPLLGLGSLAWHLSRNSSKPASDDEMGTRNASDSTDEASKVKKKDGLPLSDPDCQSSMDDQERDKAAKDEKSDSLPITEASWQWSIYDQYTDTQGRVKLTKREVAKSEETESGPFRVIYRNKENQQWPEAVEITLYSKSLCRIVSQYHPKNGDLKTLDEPSILGRELYIVLDALKNHKFHKAGSEKASVDGLPNGNGVLEHHGIANGHALNSHGLTNSDADILDDISQEEAELHLKHLVRFIEKEYKDVTVRAQRMLEEKKVAWDVLWTFLPSGEKVVYRCDQSGELLYAVVLANYFQFSMAGMCFVLQLEIWEFDGINYKKCPITRQIRKYEGERSFAGLAVCPARILGAPEILEERFLESGKKYLDLTMKEKHRFMDYSGPLFQQRRNGSCWNLHKEKADGRVMIDFASFAKMNPDYPMGNARPPTGSPSSFVRTRNGVSTVNTARDESFDGPSPAAALESVTNDNLIFAPGIVYGFSFTLKLWGSFAISGFRAISFDSSAFDQLVMEPQMKGLLHNLVSHYLASPEDGSQRLQRVDPISNKGNGCIFLCYGPPGTGKTLTAESLAETLERPLWALNVSELGTTPKELEQTLFKVLDIAVAWQALLLLDEADVYLERRVSGADVTRNAMTGVFLRMLEYYRGVLFLTTNRITTFDEAFRSRISMFLHYSPLSIQHKEQIWKTLLRKAQVIDVSSEKLSELAALDFNGREIRNAIHTAQSWSESNREILEFRHIEYVISVLETSLKALNEALHEDK